MPSSDRPGCDFPPHVNQAGAFMCRLKGEKTRLCPHEPFLPGGGGVVGLRALLFWQFTHLRPAHKGEQRDRSLGGDQCYVRLILFCLFEHAGTPVPSPNGCQSSLKCELGNKIGFITCVSFCFSNS